MGPNTLLLNKRNVVISDAIVTKAGDTIDGQKTPIKPTENRKTTPSSTTDQIKENKEQPREEVGKTGKTTTAARKEVKGATKNTPQRAPPAASLNKPLPVNSSSTNSKPEVQQGTEAHPEAVTRGENNDSDVWTQNQQKQLELALQQFPRTVADRWMCIALAVPGKTKVRHLCIIILSSVAGTEDVARALPCYSRADRISINKQARLRNFPSLFEKCRLFLQCFLDWINEIRRLGQRLNVPAQECDHLN